MRLSWNLGRVAGIDLFLHPSALLVYFLVSGVMSNMLGTIALGVAVLGSIVLHELGHALMARRYGIATADITLYLFGGVARLERMPRSAGPELLIALAGPAVNFVIVLGLGMVLGLAAFLGLPSPGILPIVLQINLVLGLFNLLPVFPMDGGRVLRAILSGWLGRLRATEVAASIGRAIAVVGGAYFLMNGMVQPLILAIFVFMMGSLELRQVQAEGRPDGGSGRFTDVPPPPPGFRWASGGDGIWRLVPIMVHVQPGAWAIMELTPIVELGVAELHEILTGRLGQSDLPPLDAIENEDWGRDLLLSRFESISAEELAEAGLTRDEGWDRSPPPR